MRNVLLVAWRDFRQVTMAKGFWITLLILPVALGISALAGRMGRDDGGAAYVLVDQARGQGEAIAQALELEHQRRVLADVASYVRKWRREGAQVEIPDAALPDAQVRAFAAAGGADVLLSRMKNLLEPDAPPYKPPAPLHRRVAAPEVAMGSTAAAYDVLKPMLGEKVDGATVRTAIYLPPDYPASPAQVWTHGRPNVAFLTVVRGSLGEAQRAQALAGAGIDAQALARIEALQAPVQVSVEERDSARDRRMAGSALPLILAYLLMMSLLMSGSMLLQGLMEERSNKLLEAVLACVSPSQLMYGKLLGLGAAAMVLVLGWVACAAAATFWLETSLGGILRPLLTGFDAGLVLATVYFFLAGYLVYAMVFLAIGTMAESMQDAQAYLVPVMMALILPFAPLVNAVLQNPEALFPKVMSWIPIYTPMAMLARMGGGVPAWEVIGASVLLAAFVAVELLLLGRVFQASLLNSGRAPKLSQLLRLMRTRPS